MEADSTLYASNAIVRDLAVAEDADGVVGALFVSAPNKPDVTIIWFRNELAHSVRWAGNPEQAHAADATGRISPRKSFDQFLQDVRGQCLPWSPEELASASELNSLIEIEELRRESFRYQLLQDTASDGIHVLDEAGNLIEANRAFCAMVGYELGELLGKNVSHWNVMEMKEQLEQLFHPGALHDSLCESRFRRKDGSEFDAEISVTSFVVDDRRLHYCSARDVTVRKLAEKVLVQAKEDLERRVAERTRNLVEANGELQTITYTLAHDLRAPARHIAGFAGELTEAYSPILEDQGRRWLRLLMAAATRQGELIEDMLRYMKLGFSEIVRKPIDMKALAEEVAQESREEVPRSTEIAFRIADLPAASADRALVRVILSNLVANAVKYSANQAHPEIEVGSVTDAAGEVAYFVRDNGVGFDSARAARLFGLFQRFHDSSEYPGTGIGLAIVKRLVVIHGGRVWADSQASAGATFHFTLEPAAGKHAHG